STLEVLQNRPYRYRGYRPLYPLPRLGRLVDDRADHPRQWRLYDQVRSIAACLWKAGRYWQGSPRGVKRPILRAFSAASLTEGSFALQEFAHFQQDEFIVIGLVEETPSRERQVVIIADDNMRVVHAIHILDG